MTRWRTRPRRESAATEKRRQGAGGVPPLLTAALGLVCGGQDRGPGDAGVAPEMRPNVVVYVVDTLRADSLGAYGHPAVDTPAADRLAREGTLFENAVASSSWTRASFASLLTGIYPEAVGVETRQDGIAGAAILLSELFEDAGYATAALVTNPNVGSFFGFDQGFDTFLELYTRDTPGHVRAAELITPSDELSEYAIDWIKDAARPFFLVLLSIDPHAPYTPPAAFDRYGHGPGREPDTESSLRRADPRAADRARARARYLGEVAFNDHSLGRLLDFLRDEGLCDQTLIALTSDHGEELWEHGSRGHGLTLYEESIRVPLILRDPREAGGVRVPDRVSTVDLFPTLLVRAGLSVPPGIDGRVLSSARAAQAPRALFASLEIRGRSLRSVTQAPWKLIVDQRSGSQQLFELDADPDESNDLSETNVERRRVLHGVLVAHLDERTRRGAELRASSGGTPLPAAAMPAEARRALEALGYVDTADVD